MLLLIKINPVARKLKKFKQSSEILRCRGHLVLAAIFVQTNRDSVGDMVSSTPTHEVFAGAHLKLGGLRAQVNVFFFLISF